VTSDDYHPNLFTETSHVIDNEYFPLTPGTRYVWKGEALDDEGVPTERKVVFIVTDLVKEIDGVRVNVGWDRDFDDDSMRESELIFHAQDMHGNVWHLGELVEHWEDGELDGARTWFVDSPEGATPGIAMLADPQVGDEYSQGFAPPPWFWDDRARIAEMGGETCVPVGCFDSTLVVEEYEPRFPRAFQLKYYAPGVGSVRVGWRGRNDSEHEEMVLIKHHQLTPEALDRVRERVLAQDQRAYAYGLTAPAQIVGTP
jgi:hypothetical protein